ncbi:MAG: hypothetical protein A3D31_10310 [Candidatus Fluviicola riflensis]|nr:MAG: hypothetical protein CHH17_14730 [Candidatus Fluviicola riflensis]OGS77396.1 MAG: hypothetical protein A3D31_10310 [Candidatus Fluviicola riflensis]OGS83976.1 MAG: hypothetical protein A3E30_11710 [Fluviicola sp. RIFCSPHIGHO2_12_FULL_43_24]OGS84463.1 MAG: hypothetical protein A2724_07250 [Fluviicola sp. RIFCSPHIGHO2_01_FULL_43_53]
MDAIGGNNNIHLIEWVLMNSGDPILMVVAIEWICFSSKKVNRVIKTSYSGDGVLFEFSAV